MARVREGKFASLQTKLAWTALFFVLFMVGRNIPIPLLHDSPTNLSETHSDLLNAANIATGGNFFSPSFFSLGLGPWMGAAILWRFLFIGKLARDRRIPEETVDRARYVVMVVLAIIQAISLMSAYDIDPLGFGPFDDVVNAQVLVVILFVAGALVVTWLAQQNEDKGLGGITMFILYQILISALRNMQVLGDAASTPGFARVLWLVALACVIVAVIGVFFGNSEIRLHVNKVAIDNGYTGVSYLPLKLNPAGASPIMYAMAILALPQYVARAIGAVIPSARAGTDSFVQTWGLTSTFGFITYLVLLFVLTIFFGLITVNPKDAAKRMQDSGQYFDNVPPGEPTREFLRWHVIVLSVASGLFLVVLTGLPLAFLGQYPTLQWVLMLPGTVMIVLGLLWMLQEEIADTLIGKRYQFSFRTESEARA